MAIPISKRPSQTRTRWGRLSSVFRAGSDTVLHQHISRLCVLYEDLRIELHGMAAEHLDRLDETDRKVRQTYFQRRSVGTMYEFAQALRLLNDLPDFQFLKGNFGRNEMRLWTRAVGFFGKYENRIKQIRHDVGGHFGADAARYAIQNFLPEAQGRMDICLFAHGGGGARLAFSSEIAATALIRHVPGHGSEAKVRRLLLFSMVAFRKAIWAVDVIAVRYVWPRLGK